MTYNFYFQSTTEQKAELITGVSAVKYFQTEYEQYKTPLKYTSTWHISDAVSLSGKRITYGYSEGYYSSESIPVRYAEYRTAPAIKVDYRMIYSTYSYKPISIRADQ